jgi:hypothetical protein
LAEVVLLLTPVTQADTTTATPEAIQYLDLILQLVAVMVGIGERPVVVVVLVAEAG